MSTNDFLPFGDGVGANVVTQAVYLAAAWRLSGFEPGLADAAQANKAWRQASIAASQLAQFMCDTLNTDILDDGTPAEFLANLKAALGITPSQARLVTDSANFVMASSDCAIGLKRTVLPAITQVTLPAGVNGKVCFIEDLASNFSQYPVTVVPPAGTIGTRANFVLNEDNQCGMFRFYSDANAWSVKA